MKLSIKNAHAALIQNDLRWVSVVARDPEANGKFFYSVSTTGIYCRPSCAARLAKPEHVNFYTSTAEAEMAGFRPCKRCNPNEISLSEHYSEVVTKACRLLETIEPTPSLEILATEVGLSKYHLHRVFKQVTGVTPKAYALAHRAKKLREQLADANSITDAIYSAGYNANSRFYEKSNKVLGMTATNYRAGGSNTEIRFAVGQCSLGAILVAQSERGVCAILMGDDPQALVEDLQNRFSHAHLMGGDSEFEKLVAHVVGFVEAPNIGLTLPLDIRGTAFQQRVWQALCDIPVGTTASYTEIANRIGAPKAFRAVALACAANALAVAIPCHRVVRNDGGLSGYRWGVDRKRALLDLEAQQVSLQSKNKTDSKKIKK